MPTLSEKLAIAIIYVVREPSSENHVYWDGALPPIPQIPEIEVEEEFNLYLEPDEQTKWYAFLLCEDSSGEVYWLAPHLQSRIANTKFDEGEISYPFKQGEPTGLQEFIACFTQNDPNKLRQNILKNGLKENGALKDTAIDDVCVFLRASEKEVYRRQVMVVEAEDGCCK
ncbi:MAG: hypothetical protein HQL69_12285 [Magnetococcales bacterium]|nr:hypothetical protein [Magnetococcales bacterium]